jgi:GNAT superfamily N-acetyltransferase
MTEADLETANGLLQASFNSLNDWRSTLRHYLHLQPEGWVFAVEGDQTGVAEQIAGMVGITNYGSFAYIGMMAVHPAHQRKGIGGAVMEYALQWIGGRGVPITLLDATKEGDALYRKLGFVPRGNRPLLDYRHPEPPAPPTAALEVVTPALVDELTAFDAPIFGAERRRVLASMIANHPDRGLLLRDTHGNLAAYALADLRRIGPMVATTPEAGEQVVRGMLQLPFETYPMMITPFDNKAAISLLVQLGFSSLRSCVHMQRGGEAHPGQIDKLYGQVSYAIG